MTPLYERVLARIRASGPISVEAFLETALYDRDHGYYRMQRAIGAAGDFITAPEVSQVFGEAVGLWIVATWQALSSPDPVLIVELGPGRGTLLADALRAIGRLAPALLAIARLHLIETSRTLALEQRRALAGVGLTAAPVWHAQLGSVPAGPTIALANEFFDALPIRQFVRAGDGWRERLVGADGGTLVFGLGGPVIPEALAHRGDVAEGKLVETCPALAPIMAEIDARISTHGGAALIIDYGDWRSLGDTLQAVQGHVPQDPLARPGEADLTAHVDFEALVRAAPGLDASAMTPQGVFLERLGITRRAGALAAQLNGPALDGHIAAHRRLTHPLEMGTLFKVIAFVPEGAPMLPGLVP